MSIPQDKWNPGRGFPKVRQHCRRAVETGYKGKPARKPPGEMTGSAAYFNDTPSLRKLRQQPFEESPFGAIHFSTASCVIPRLIVQSLFLEDAPPHFYTGQAFDTVTVMTT
jgi:hypothetical protein